MTQIRKGLAHLGVPLKFCRAVGVNQASKTRLVQALWYNIREEREYLEVSLTGLKARPVFGKAKP